MTFYLLHNYMDFIRHGIGFNNIDLEAAKENKTIISIVPALVERDAVAENNITNLLAVMRKTVLAYNSVKKIAGNSEQNLLEIAYSIKLRG